MKSDISGEFEAFYLKDKSNLVNALKSFYNTTSSIRFFVLADFTVLFFNKKAEKEASSLIGKKIKTGIHIKKLFKRSDIQEDFLARFQVAIKGEVTWAEYLIGPCDKRVWYKIEYYPVIYEMKIIGVSISIRNINSRKQTDQLLLHKNNVLKEILHTHSHIIRSPLSNILGLTLLFDRSEFTGENLELLELVEATANKLDVAIKEITAKAYDEPTL